MATTFNTKSLEQKFESLKTRNVNEIKAFLNLIKPLKFIPVSKHITRRFALLDLDYTLDIEQSELHVDVVTFKHLTRYVFTLVFRDIYTEETVEEKWFTADVDSNDDLSVEPDFLDFDRVNFSFENFNSHDSLMVTEFDLVKEHTVDSTRVASLVEADSKNLKDDELLDALNSLDVDHTKWEEFYVDKKNKVLSLPTKRGRKRFYKRVDEKFVPVKPRKKTVEVFD